MTSRRARQDSLNHAARHEPVVGGLRLRRRRPRRSAREHRRRPFDRLGRRVHSYLVPFDPFGMPTISRNPSAEPAGSALRLREELRRRSVCSRALLQRSDAERRAVRRARACPPHGRRVGRTARRPARPAARPEHNHRDIHRTTNVLPIGSGPDITPGQILPPVVPPVMLDPLTTLASLVGSPASRISPSSSPGWRRDRSYTITDMFGTPAGHRYRDYRG